jgi:uncharacterized protein
MISQTNNQYALVDSSFLYAVFAKNDRHHKEAVEFTVHYSGKLIFPEIVLPEVIYLFRRSSKMSNIIEFLEVFSQAQPNLECLTPADIVRAKEVMAQYVDARLDLVDCCIVALAERLNITRICTFDQRDFGIIRPAHADFLDIAP